MKRQLLVVNYCGDNTIDDKAVEDVARAFSEAVGDNFNCIVLTERDILGLVAQKAISTGTQARTVILIEEDLKHALNFIQGITGDPKDTSSKTGESIYIEKLYKAFVGLFAVADDKRKLYKNAVEVILRYANGRMTEHNKAQIQYMRRCGFTKRIVETLAHQYDFLKLAQLCIKHIVTSSVIKTNTETISRISVTRVNINEWTLISANQSAN